MAKPAQKGIPRTVSTVTLIYGLSFMMNAPVAYGAETTTKVTTYVVQTQEEREQTKWTLTQWLRIIERMKLMDVWLAMFSDPNKDRFRPEFNLSILGSKSALQRKVDGVLTDDGTGQGQTIKGQLWLTNLVSSQFGIRTLNLDLGLEAGRRDSGSLTAKSSTNSSGLSSTLSANRADSAAAKTNWYSVNLRLFGKHIQDSSLVIKYGVMQTTNSLYLPNTPSTIDMITNPAISKAAGTFKGAELQMYLIRSVGLEGTVHQYQANTVAYADHTLEGAYGEGLLFIEVGILRLQAGIYEERWNASWTNVKTSTKESGYVGGIKLQL